MKLVILVNSLVVIMISGCQSLNNRMAKTDTIITQLDFSAGPPTIIYKTKHDYTDNVAILLTADKTGIASYPHPRDIAKKSNRVKPTILTKGYLLDNQGINERVAFTSYTFAQYAALPKAPSLDELKASIIDQDPLIFLWNCGNRNQYTQLEETMNRWISQKLSPCQSIIADK